MQLIVWLEQLVVVRLADWQLEAVRQVDGRMQAESGEEFDLVWEAVVVAEPVLADLAASWDRNRSFLEQWDWLRIRVRVDSHPGSRAARPAAAPRGGPGRCP